MQVARRRLVLIPLALTCIEKLDPRLVLRISGQPNTTDGLHMGAGVLDC